MAESMPGIVYLLCAVTSLASAFLLWRASGKGGSLLFWAGVFFVGMALNNVLLYIDLVAYKYVDIGMAAVPHSVALASVGMLLAALIWHTT